MFKKVVFALAGSLALVTAASAADLPVKARVAPVAAPIVDWTGFYIGGYVGGAWANTDTFISGTAAPIQISSESFLAGVQAGYDWQLPNRLVLGVRVSAPVTGGSDKSVNDPLFPFISYTSDFNWAVLGTFQVGYAIDRWLPYVGIGVGFGEGEGTVRNTLFNFTETATSSHTGFIANVGVRYMLSQNWWTALQYTYTNWGDANYSYVIPGQTVNVGYELHALTVQLSYKF